MTNEEALQYFKEVEFIDKWGPDEAGNGDPLIQQADEARLKAIDALEKQIPKKPQNENNWHYYCPQCGEEITVLFFNVEKMSHEQRPSKFCSYCGQAIEGDNHDTQA